MASIIKWGARDSQEDGKDVLGVKAPTFPAPSKSWKEAATDNTAEENLRKVWNNNENLLILTLGDKFWAAYSTKNKLLSVVLLLVFKKNWAI